MKILVVIPARGGSKRIPRKNVRFMCGKPLIAYSIENAKLLQGKFDMDAAVSTDDEELAGLSEKRDIEVLDRPAELATDKVTLAPVIDDAVKQMEARHGVRYDIVITMQATSPTLQSHTIERAIRTFMESDCDTLLSATNKPHLSWREENGVIVKNYEKRLNSQDLPANYLETGGFFITRREFVNEQGNFGEKVSIFEVPASEAVDIDTEEDWIVAESILKRKRILFRTVGKMSLGMGHIYRCLTLADKLMGHDLLFVLDEDSDIGIKKLRESFFPMEIVKDDADYERVLKSYRPDILVNDILDTSEEYMSLVRKYAGRIVNFEDLGKGSRMADVVINALYEDPKAPKYVYGGFKYYCIRDEFLEEKPKKFREEVENIMIIFGGADPSDLTGRLYDICKVLHGKFPHIDFHFITGFAYPHKDEIITDEENHIFVHHDVKRVSAYMCQADLAITSQGRTIYELASMGVPAIVLAQNEREAEHVFAGMENGFLNLGLGSEQDALTIIQTIRFLIETPKMRRDMRKLQLAKEFYKGQERVIDLILNLPEHPYR